MTEIAAVTLCILLAALAIFQASLIAGAPIGRFAWGGAHDILPTKLRIGSVTSIILYIVFAIVALNQAHLITLLDTEHIGEIAIWVLFAYFTVGIPLNAISRSKPERNLMTPVVAVLAALTLIVALH